MKFSSSSTTKAGVQSSPSLSSSFIVVAAAAAGALPDALASASSTEGGAPPKQAECKTVPAVNDTIEAGADASRLSADGGVLLEDLSEFAWSSVEAVSVYCGTGREVGPFYRAATSSAVGSTSYTPPDAAAPRIKTPPSFVREKADLMEVLRKMSGSVSVFVTELHAQVGNRVFRFPLRGC